MNVSNAYAEIDDYNNRRNKFYRKPCDSFSSDYSSLASISTRFEHLEPEYSNIVPMINSHLPIDYRYRPRSNQKSSNPGSTVSGYSSASSSSIQTIINGETSTKPHTANSPRLVLKKSVGTTTMVTSSSTSCESPPPPPSRPCCIECREKELREEFHKEQHVYENFRSKPKDVNPYVFLMTNVLNNLRLEENGRKVVKVQQKVEKVLRLRASEPLPITSTAVYEEKLKVFGQTVEIRLRAIEDVSPETFREIRRKFCEALHGSSNSTGIKSILKNVKNFFL